MFAVILLPISVAESGRFSHVIITYSKLQYFNHLSIFFSYLNHYFRLTNGISITFSCFNHLFFFFTVSTDNP